MKHKEQFEYLIGMNSEVARIELESEKLDMRMVEHNGEPCLITMDIRSNRVNVAITDGTITAVHGVY
jgi:hypothetical protein